MIRFVLFLCVIATTLSAQTTKSCLLKGEVIDRPESTLLLLLPKDADARTSNPLKIPIKDGKFSVSVPVGEPVLYNIIFDDDHRKGSWFPVDFIMEEGVCSFTLYPMDRNKETKVLGGALDTRYRTLKTEVEKLFSLDELYKKRDDLDREGRYYNEEANELFKELAACQDADQRNRLYKKRDTMNLLTADGLAVDNKLKQVIDNRYEWLIDKATENVSEAELAILNEIIEMGVVYHRKVRDFDRAVTLYDAKYSEHFALNPMVIKMNELLMAYKNIKVGGRYLDFTAPDLNGRNVKLSDQIKGKVALIDMWASWCGPCISTSLTMIPLYNQYKNRGFTIVGVARENKNTDALKAALDRHKFPWINLVELDDAGRIWYLYGISNAAGGIYLVDKEGTILEVNPDAEQVEQYLKRLCP